MPQGPDAASRLSKYDAHPFEPVVGPDGAERCALCGERRMQIRHHPTRIAAACLMRGIDPPGSVRHRR